MGQKEDNEPPSSSGSDVLSLNVGGTRVQVLRRTLTSCEGSMLASRFSGRWDESLEQDSQESFFIDQPPYLFLRLLDYLRHKSNETCGFPPARVQTFEDEEEHDNFFRMVGYYGMAEQIYQVNMFQINTSQQLSAENKSVIRLNPFGKHLAPSDRHSFLLLPCDSSMFIKSFECKIFGYAKFHMTLHCFENSVTNEEDFYRQKDIHEENATNLKVLRYADNNEIRVVVAGKGLNQHSHNKSVTESAIVHFDGRTISVFSEDTPLEEINLGPAPFRHKHYFPAWNLCGKFAFTQIEVSSRV